MCWWFTYIPNVLSRIFGFYDLAYLVWSFVIFYYLIKVSYILNRNFFYPLILNIPLFLLFLVLYKILIFYLGGYLGRFLVGSWSVFCFVFKSIMYKYCCNEIISASFSYIYFYYEVIPLHICDLLYSFHNLSAFFYHFCFLIFKL